MRAVLYTVVSSVWSAPTDETQLLQRMLSKQKAKDTLSINSTSHTDFDGAQCGSSAGLDDGRCLCPNYHYPWGPGSFNGWAKCGNDVIHTDHNHCKASMKHSGWYQKCPGACGRTFAQGANFRSECMGDGSAAPRDYWPACFCNHLTHDDLDGDGRPDRKACYDDCFDKKQNVGWAMKPVCEDGQCDCPNYHYPWGPGSFNGWAKCGNNVINPDHNHCSMTHSGWYQKCPGACGRKYPEGEDFREHCHGESTLAPPKDYWPACFCNHLNDLAERKACYQTCFDENAYVNEEPAWPDEDSVCPDYALPWGTGSWNAPKLCWTPQQKHCEKKTGQTYLGVSRTDGLGSKCAGSCNAAWPHLNRVPSSDDDDIAEQSKEAPFKNNGCQATTEQDADPSWFACYCSHITVWEEFTDCIKDCSGHYAHKEKDSLEQAVLDASEDELPMAQSQFEQYCSSASEYLD